MLSTVPTASTVPTPFVFVEFLEGEEGDWQAEGEHFVVVFSRFAWSSSQHLASISFSSKDGF